MEKDICKPKIYFEEIDPMSKFIGHGNQFTSLDKIPIGTELKVISEDDYIALQYYKPISEKHMDPNWYHGDMLKCYKGELAVGVVSCGDLKIKKGDEIYSYPEGKEFRPGMVPDIDNDPDFFKDDTEMINNRWFEMDVSEHGEHVESWTLDSGNYKEAIKSAVKYVKG